VYLGDNSFVSGIIDGHNQKLPCTIYISSIRPDVFILAEPNKFPTLAIYTLRSVDEKELKIPEDWKPKLKGDLGIRFKVYSRSACKVKILAHFRTPRLEKMQELVLPKAMPRRLQDFEWDEYLDFQIYRPPRKRKKQVPGTHDHVQSNITEVTNFDKQALLIKAAEEFKKAERLRLEALVKKEKVFLAKQLAVFKNVLRREIKEEIALEKFNQELAVDIRSTFKKYLFNSFWTFLLLADIDERVWKTKLTKFNLRSKARHGYLAFMRILTKIRKRREELAKLGQMKQTLKAGACFFKPKVHKKASRIGFIFVKEYLFADAARRSFLLYIARGKMLLNRSKIHHEEDAQICKNQERRS
jgi:hypothetical protein